MAQSPRLSDGVDLAAAPRASVQPFGTGAQRPHFQLDSDLARLTSANLLVIGPEPPVSNLVFALWSSFTGPVVTRRRGEPLHLPKTSDPVGTLVLYGVDTLTHDEQRALCDWLGGTSGRTRVVSTISAPLLPMVERRAFSDGLYYRLNTLCIDLRSAA